MLEPAQRRARLEGLRYAAVLKQQAAQHATVLLHWGALWRQLSCPCGAWALRWEGLREGAGLGKEGPGAPDCLWGEAREESPGIYPQGPAHPAVEDVLR